MLGNSSIIVTPFPTNSRENTNIGRNRLDRDNFALQSYHGHIDDYQHRATVASKGVRDPRRRNGDTESQESIVGKFDHETDSKEGVLVTRTVEIA
jgi:hypothetical protein